MTRDGFLLIVICLLTLLCGITTLAVIDSNSRIRGLEAELEKQALLHDDLAHYVHTSDRLLSGELAWPEKGSGPEVLK